MELEVLGSNDLAANAHEQVRPRDCVQVLAAEPSAAADFADADRKVAHQVVD